MYNKQRGTGMTHHNNMKKQHNTNNKTESKIDLSHLPIVASTIILESGSFDESIIEKAKEYLELSFEYANNSLKKVTPKGRNEGFNINQNNK